MTLRTLIIDDEPIALEKLKKYVERTPKLHLAGACANGFEALEFMRNNEVDLIISDINMPDLNGLDFVKTLSQPPLIIFTTAHPQYAIDGYKVSAVDFLLKPYSYVDFYDAVVKSEDRLKKKMTFDKKDYVFVKVDYKYIRVALSEICFIKGYGEYLQIYTVGKQNPLVTLSSFASIKESLSQDFIQVHRSYIVNVSHIERIERNMIVMDNEISIPVSDSYRTSFQTYLASHSIGKK